jgi:competence protein ComEA
MKPTHFLSKRALPPVFLTLGFTSLFTLMGMTLTFYWPAGASGSGASVNLEASVRSSATPDPVTVSVVITGAIQHPGVYQVSAHARLEEVVALAGGSTEEAALLPRGLLAQGIYAGQIVHIPTQPAQQFQRTRRVDPDMIKTVAGTHRKPKKRSSHQTPLAKGPIKKIDINRADLKELVKLPGVGPALAKRIMQARKQKPFANAKELISRVKGIGPAKYKKLAGWVK